MIHAVWPCYLALSAWRAAWFPGSTHGAGMTLLASLHMCNSLGLPCRTAGPGCLPYGAMACVLQACKSERLHGTCKHSCCCSAC